ncbi:MAG: Do family serine endopeptidase [Synergistaceae bacterium]|jgi:serine protease Do|nr:Do family serine endopeptidase [Synergistaceae bacterium]
MRVLKRCVGLSLLLALIFLPAGSPASAASGNIYADAKNPVVQIVKAVSPAVVNIDVETMSKSSSLPLPFRNDPFFREFFGEEFRKFSRSVPMKGRGSGFIVSKDGQILTNNHVVEGVDKITVTLVDGKIYEATVLGRDPTYDLAVISISPDGNLPVLELGDSDALEVGEWAIAIGNPYGLEHTVTVGVISAKNRSLHTREVNFDGFLQTDAAINPGNSGGPLLNMEGRVIGINTAIVPYAQGLGFAVPVNMAKQIMNDLVTYGKVKRGWLGIAVQNLTKEFADAYDVDAETGIIVGDVFPDSAAAKADLRRGDVIVEMNGNTVKDMQSFVNAVRSQSPGARIRLKVIRSGKAISITPQLDEIPESEGGVASSSGEQTQKDTLADVGISVSPLTPELRRQYGIEGGTGLIVTGVAQESPAQSAGIREGDLLLEVNGKKVGDQKQLDVALGKGSSIVLLIERSGRTFFASLRLEDKK